MKVEQIYSIVNDMTKDHLGENAELASLELGNVISVGKTLFESMPVDNYVRSLVNHIGKVVFVNRPYSGRAPSVLMDGWEYGSIMQKIDMGIPEAEKNPKWDLKNGQRYEQDVFNGPQDVRQKFFNDRTTFQVPFSFAEDQVKESFSSVEQLNGFFSMIYTQIDLSLTIKTDALVMATITNFIANIYNSGKAAQKINLLAEYNAAFPTANLTAAQAPLDMDFIKFASMRMKEVSSYMGVASTNFNKNSRIRHTPTDRQKIIMLQKFAAAADTYLQSDTFHNEFVKLPSADKVAFWQGSGDSFAFEDISAIDVIPATENGAGTEVKLGGILAIIFDREALGVNNFNSRVTQHYNANGEFINNWYKRDAQYFNDFSENFVMFYIADTATQTTNLKK